MGTNRTINDEIIDIFNSEIEKQALPTHCTIIKVYDNNYADVSSDVYGSLIYVKVYGDYALGDKGILLFLNNDFSFPIVITGASNTDVTSLIESIAEINENLSNKSDIGHTHDYDTLNNIPSDFNPSQHIHNVDEVIGIENFWDSDLDLLLIILTDKINGT